MRRPWARRVRPDQLPVRDPAVAIPVLPNAAAGLAGPGADAPFPARGGARCLGRALAGSRPLVVAGPAVAGAAGGRAVARYPLARRLAVLVAVAGCFASVAYYVLAAKAAAEVGGDASLAGFLGGFRGAVQIVTLVVQLVIAPRLLARAGVANAL